MDSCYSSLGRLQALVLGRAVPNVGLCRGRGPCCPSGPCPCPWVVGTVSVVPVVWRLLLPADVGLWCDVGLWKDRGNRGKGGGLGPSVTVLATVGCCCPHPLYPLPLPL